MARWSGVMNSASVVRGGRALRGGRVGGGAQNGTSTRFPEMNGGAAGGARKRAGSLVVVRGSGLILGSSLMAGCLSTGSDLMLDWHVTLAFAL